MTVNGHSDQPYVGLVAVVTGAAGGMGLAVAERLVLKGAKVVGADLKGGSDFLKIGTSSNIEFVKCDVTDWSSVQNVFNKAVERFGSVDICYANAGIVAMSGFPLPLDRDRSKGPQFNELRVNVEGAMLTMQAALDVFRQKAEPSSLAASEPAWRRKWRGKIVVTASTAGLYPQPFAPTYCASKAGILHLSKAFAALVSPEHILVNAVLPGLVASPMTIDALGDSLNTAEKEGDVTPMSTMLKAFELSLPVDFANSGLGIEAVGDEIHYHKGHQYINKQTQNLWEKMFIPSHAHNTTDDYAL